MYVLQSKIALLSSLPTKQAQVCKKHNLMGGVWKDISSADRLNTNSRFDVVVVFEIWKDI